MDWEFFPIAVYFTTGWVGCAVLGGLLFRFGSLERGLQNTARIGGLSALVLSGYQLVLAGAMVEETTYVEVGLRDLMDWLAYYGGLYFWPYLFPVGMFYLPLCLTAQ